MDRRQFKFVIFLQILPVVIFFSYRTLVSAAGNLVGYWKFDETTAGSAVVDSSGSSNTGTPFNSPVPSEDIPGGLSFLDHRSLQFNGSNQHVRIPDSDTLTLVDGTFSTWIKFTSIPGWHASWLAKRNGDSQMEYQWGWTGNALKVTLANGGSTCCTDYTYTPSPSLTTGVWYHLAVTVNNTTHKLRWYQNGVFKQETNISGHAFGTNTSGNLTLGASFNGSGEFFSGFLDETRIYNRVLSDSEIGDIAAGGSGVDVATPTPSPTPAPTPTATPQASSTALTSLATSQSEQHCSDEPPSSAPDLFQISASPTSATLYFSPLKPSDGYIIQYGTTLAADQHSVTFNQSNSDGVVSYTIHSLALNTKYYFKVQGKNGCKTGKWSQVVDQTTTGTSNISPSSTNSSSPMINTTHEEVPSKSQIELPSTLASESVPTSKHDGYDLSIKVVHNGKPMEGATVEVYSTPRRTTTDKNGIARFSGVEGGNHTVYMSYDGFTGEEEIVLDGDQKDVQVNLTMNVKRNTKASSGTGFTVGVLATFPFLFLFWKKRKHY